MSRLQYILMWTVFAGGLFTFMVIAWRARKKRDAGLHLPEIGLSGKTIAEFLRVTYVSTTPAGAPFERLAIPGLSYKGWADVTVREDGVSIEVTGEHPVELRASQVLGSAMATGRAGKAVERDGLALLCWAPEHSAHEELESSFRFNTSAEQLRFADAISALVSTTTDHSRTSQERGTNIIDSLTTQEDA